MAETLLTNAIERMLARIDTTMGELAKAGEAGEAGFPHVADPETGNWTYSPSGDWTGGFWNGLLWLAAHCTGEQRYRTAALAWTQRLRPRITSETVFRGFLFWYGAAIGDLLLGDPTARQVALEGAQGLAQLYNPTARLIPLGVEAEEASQVGRGETNIDGVPGSTPLLCWAARHTGSSSLEEKALAHAQQHSEFCVRSDGSVCQSASFDTATGRLLRRYTHKGVSDDSTWGRAQAWGMLGFAQAAHLAPERFTAVALRVCDWWIAHLPAGSVAFWDFDDPALPDAPLDTSATAIAASALLKMAAMVPEQARRYRRTAEAMVHALISRHLTPTTADDHRPPGILTDGCYNYRIGLATRNELIWGDYFLFETLLALSEHIDPAGL